MPEQRYGYYRYGRHEFRAEDRPDRTPPDRDTGPTPYERFGAGVALRTADDNDGTGVPWDFVTDASGDLAATAGYDELAKNLAFATATDASTIRGSLGTANERARLERDIEQTATENVHISAASARVRAAGGRARLADGGGGGGAAGDRIQDVETLGVDLTVTTDDGDTDTVTIQLDSDTLP